MIVFPGVIPTIGLGALTTPEDMSVLIGTEKEKTIFTPRHEDWQELGEQCAEEGIGVNMFFANSRPVDLASICERGRYRTVSVADADSRSGGLLGYRRSALLPPPV